MAKKFAPSGATGSACLSDLITIDRGYLDSIVALLRDPTCTRGPGLTGIVDSFEQAIATSDLPGASWKRFSASIGLPEGGYVTVSAPRRADLETSIIAVRAAFEPAFVQGDEEAQFWATVDRQIDERWSSLSSVVSTDIQNRLRLERLRLELSIAERDRNDHDEYVEERALSVLRIKELKLKILDVFNAVRSLPPLEDHTGPAAESPEALAAAKLAARDASRPVQIDAFIEWDDGGCSNFEGDAEQFAALVESFELEGRSLL